MPRQKYQRPEVYRWIGKSGEKFWKAEWRQYIEGRPKPKHRAATWPCKEYTKTAAQKACDQLVQEETGGGAHPDGSMTVAGFWEKVYWPMAERRVAPNTRKTYACSWNKHVKPFIGKVELQHVSKHAVSGLLDRMADAGKGKQTIQTALVVVSELFRDALESGYIERNPVWRVTIPRVKERKETRPMTEAEVRRLFANTARMERLWWRILVLTGARVGELLALSKSDVLPGMLRVDESAFEGKAAQTKNRKVRYAAIPDSLRAELDEWSAGVEGDLLFTTSTGSLYRRYSDFVQGVMSRARAAAGIPDLTFRMCRTTFSTLYDGDPRDLQAALGHSKVDTTLGIYRKPQAARQKASVEELDARLSGKVVEMKPKEAAG